VGGCIKSTPRRGWLAICFLKFHGFVLNSQIFEKHKNLLYVCLSACESSKGSAISPFSLSSAPGHIYQLLNYLLSA
jgi:hypothetical protein